MYRPGATIVPLFLWAVLLSGAGLLALDVARGRSATPEARTVATSMAVLALLFGPLAFAAYVLRFCLVTATLDPRQGVLLSGGFETWTIPAESDPVNFAPRVSQPVLMVNGRDDFDLPYETAQVPLFKALGTAASDKRHAVLDGGHIPRRPQAVYKEVLDWLDRHLGPVTQ